MIWNERESSQLQETVSLLKDVNNSVQSSLKSRPKQLTIQKYLFTFLKDFLSLRESLNKTIFEFLKSEISQSNIRDTWFEYESGWDLRDYSMCTTGEYLKENPPTLYFIPTTSYFIPPTLKSMTFSVSLLNAPQT